MIRVFFVFNSKNRKIYRKTSCTKIEFYIIFIKNNSLHENLKKIIGKAGRFSSGGACTKLFVAP